MLETEDYWFDGKTKIGDHHETGDIHYVEDLLNRWSQIEDLNNSLSFIDLQKFLLDGMQMQAHYQLVRTLLESARKSNRCKIGGLNRYQTKSRFLRIEWNELF